MGKVFSKIGIRSLKTDRETAILGTKINPTLQHHNARSKIESCRKDKDEIKKILSPYVQDFFEVFAKAYGDETGIGKWQKFWDME
eukprot:m.73425 g.73425  ORF g.73425 m.73425 type:complete len:85 (-) comp12412_c0_seq1:52-306(-)